MTEPSQPVSFETQLQRLESIVTSMEQGELSLDEALKHFEEGVKLTQSCQQTLEQARQRVQILTKNNELVDFAHHSEESL